MPGIRGERAGGAAKSTFPAGETDQVEKSGRGGDKEWGRRDGPPAARGAAREDSPKKKSRRKAMVRHFPENGMKLLLEHPRKVRDLFALTEDEVVPLIDFQRLKRVRGTFVTRDYRHVESDLLLTAPRSRRSSKNCCITCTRWCIMSARRPSAGPCTSASRRQPEPTSCEGR
jgi:hypothetical protein